MWVATTDFPTAAVIAHASTTILGMKGTCASNTIRPCLPDVHATFRRASTLATAVFAVLVGSIVHGDVRVDISKRQDITQSRYAKLSGTLHASSGPAAVYVLRPKNAAEANGAALVEVADEQHRTQLRRFNRGGPNPDPDSVADLGDGFLMKYGFTLVSIDRGDAIGELVAWIQQPDAALATKHVYELTFGPRNGVLHELGVDMPKTFSILTAADEAATALRSNNDRWFRFVGAPREPARFPPIGVDDRHVENTVDYWWSMRALLLAFHRWVTTDLRPPDSGDVLLPEVAVPLAEYSATAAVPFARDEIRRRYPSHDIYRAKIREATDGLVRRRLLLYDDVDRVVQRANNLWDVTTSAR